MTSFRPYAKALISGAGTIIAGVVFAATDGFTATEVVELVILVLTTAGVYQAENAPLTTRADYRPESGT